LEISSASSLTAARPLTRTQSSRTCGALAGKQGGLGQAARREARACALRREQPARERQEARQRALVRQQPRAAAVLRHLRPAAHVRRFMSANRLEKLSAPAARLPVRTPHLGQPAGSRPAGSYNASVSSPRRRAGARAVSISDSTPLSSALAPASAAPGRPGAARRRAPPRPVFARAASRRSKAVSSSSTTFSVPWQRAGRAVSACRGWLALKGRAGHEA